jgi:hypothetical protein
MAAAMIENTAETFGRIGELPHLTISPTESSVVATTLATEKMKLENVNHEIYIDYKYHQRIISVCQIKAAKKSTGGTGGSSSSSSLYRLVGVKYRNKNISTNFIKLSLKQAIQNVILSPKSFDSKKKNQPCSDHESDDESLNESSSPICVSSFPEDSHIYDQLYDKRVITSFKEIIFKCDDEELSSYQMVDHIPILISIEGNIGAGKSESPLPPSVTLVI